MVYDEYLSTPKFKVAAIKKAVYLLNRLSFFHLISQVIKK